MKKLIEKQDSGIVVCDNPTCIYERVLSEAPIQKLEAFIDVPCPLCGENLLTKKDYETYLALLKIIDFINKWFSWITLFIPKKRLDKSYKTKIVAHCHNGVKTQIYKTK